MLKLHARVGSCLSWRLQLSFSAIPFKNGHWCQKSKCFAIGFVVKAAIVTNTVLDVDVMVCCKLFESLLCHNDLDQGEVLYQLNKLEVRVMVDKHGEHCVALGGKFSLLLHSESHLCWLESIHCEEFLGLVKTNVGAINLKLVCQRTMLSLNTDIQHSCPGKLCRACRGLHCSWQGSNGE